MARKTIFVSDLTGETIDEKNAATVTIKYADARRGRTLAAVIAIEAFALKVSANDFRRYGVHYKR